MPHIRDACVICFAGRCELVTIQNADTMEVGTPENVTEHNVIVSSTGDNPPPLWVCFYAPDHSLARAFGRSKPLPGQTLKLVLQPNQDLDSNHAEGGERI